MPGWNGSGAFTRLYSWVSDAAAGIDILASRMDSDTNLITTQGFNNCLTRDGQGAATANLPMNGFRHTNVGNAVGATDYVALGQLQSPGSLHIYASALSVTGTVDGAGIVTWAASPPPIGGTAANTGAFTNLTASIVTVTGGSVFPVANAGEYAQLAATYGVSTNVTAGLVAVNSIIANAFWATSDARIKTDVRDISIDAAYDWVSRGRPVTYVKNGSHEAGFIAQDELRFGRGASISMVEDASMAATDEASPAGFRLVKNYEHEIAYLTAALQGALKRLDALEKTVRIA